MHTSPIIVIAAIDMSESAPIVLRRAVDTARQMNAAQLHFVHVTPSASGGRLAASRCGQFGDWISTQLHSAEALPPSVAVLAHERSGEPARAIVELADKVLASCIVVGARCPNPGTSDTRLGSVAKAVVSGAACPVLIARLRSPSGSPSRAAAEAAYG